MAPKRVKRGNGEGSIQQLPSGKWRGRLMVGYKPDGRPDWRTITGETRKAVQAWIAQTRQRAESCQLGDREQERQTFGAYLDRRLEAIRANVRASTQKRYAILTRVHVKLALGQVKLRDLRPDGLRAAYANLLDEKSGLSPTTLRLIHTLIRKSLSDAVNDGILASNPAARVRPPRRAEFEAKPPTAEEVARILATADMEADDRLAGLWRLLALTGARLGELLGLAWDDVKWDRNALVIRRALEDVDDGAPVLDAPKTTRARRLLTLGEDAVAALRRHRARQAAERVAAGASWRDYGLVFTTSVGTALYERSVIRAFKAALRRAKVRDDIRIHDLRHYHITEAAHAGVSVKALSSRVGHASVAFTLDRYAHACEAADRDVAAAVERAVRLAHSPAPEAPEAASQG
jgi:integrase